MNSSKGLYLTIKKKIIDNDSVSNQSLGIIITIFLVGVITSIVSPQFLTKTNLINILQQISIAGIVTLGAAIVIISQQIDLSVGAQMTFVTCVIAVLYNSNVSLSLSVIIGIIAAVAAGFLNGYIMSKTKAESFIVTLGTMSAFQGLGLLVSKGFNFSMKGEFDFLGNGRIFSIPVSTIIFLALCIFLSLVMKHSRFGRRIYAMGGNGEAAFLAGINIRKYKMIVFTINGIIVGLAALILLSRLGSTNATIGGGFELQAIAAAVIGGVSLTGGKGSIFGCFLGILLLGVISNSLNIMNVPSFYQNIILGIIIVTAVVLSSHDKNG